MIIGALFKFVQVPIASAVGCAIASGSKCKCMLNGGAEIDLSPVFAGGALSYIKLVQPCSLSYTHMHCSLISAASYIIRE